MILKKKTQFVGTRTLALSIKFLTQSMTQKDTRMMIKPHIESILFEISLPLFMTTQKDIMTFNQDPVEYVRLQVDNQNEWNVKKQLAKFVQTLCSLKFGKKGQNQQSMHLSNYLQTIGGNLQQVSGQDDCTEALLFAFGNLNEKCAWSRNTAMLTVVQQILESFAFPALNSTSPLLQARACWVYGQFGSFKFDNVDHLRAAVDKIVQHLHSNHIAVRVDAACALSELLDHDEAVNFIRPGLEQVLRVFLKIMDEIDFEDLVGALRKIVEVFQDEIAPFAISLCTKLSEAHVRLSSQKRESNEMDDEDNETSLTADGLITAIRRVLNSISGKFPQLYPQLELILEKSLYVTLQEDSETQTEEGLNCIAELIFNQNAVSERMWGLFNCIVSNYMTDKGIIDENISAASVCIINFMVKSPSEFIGANIYGKSPLQMTLEMI